MILRPAAAVAAAFAAGLALLIWFSPTRADQTNFLTGKTANAFLDIGMGARPAGMGEAFTGIADDVTSLYWNPAGLAQVPRLQAYFMHDQWFQNVISEYGAVAFPFLDGTLGVSATYLNYGSMDKIDVFGQTQGTFGAYDLNVAAGYGFKLSRNFLAGVAVKIPVTAIDQSARVSVAGDVGALYKLPGLEKFQVGLAALNIGPNVGDATQPTQVKLGLAAVDALPGLRAALDLDERIFENSFQAAVGAEYWLFNVLAPRLGYKFSGGDSGVSGVTAGLGWRQPLTGFTISVDYAYAPYTNLGDTHRIALMVEFGTEAPAPAYAPPRPAAVPAQAAPAERFAPPPAPAPAAPPAAESLTVLPPLKIAARAVGAKIFLSWTPNYSSAAAGYNIYMRTGEHGPWVRQTPRPLTGVEARTPPLRRKHTYYFKLTAVNAWGTESSATEVVKVHLK